MKGGVPAGSTCWMCGGFATPTDPLQWDHLIPVRKGGGDDGVLPAHRTCNIRKHHGQLRAEKAAISREELDRRLYRGRYALEQPHQTPNGPGGPGAQPVPGSNPDCKDVK